MIKFRRHWLEIAGLIVLVCGLGMIAASNFGPSEFPNPPSGVDPDVYAKDLDAIRADMMFYMRLGRIGHYAFFVGGFCWIAGAVKGWRRISIEE